MLLLVHALSEKYGKGKKTTIKCQSCCYEEEIYSSGVHATESGAVMVYGADDEFSCPNCTVHDTDMNTMESVKNLGNEVCQASTEGWLSSPQY